MAEDIFRSLDFSNGYRKVRYGTVIDSVDIVIDPCILGDVL